MISLIHASSVTIIITFKYLMVNETKREIERKKERKRESGKNILINRLLFH